MENVSSNITTGMNHTNTLDYYCSELRMGPLVWGIFSIPCACVGVPASVWLLWVLVQRQRTGLSNDIYMLNLTIMDFIFNITIIPTIINNVLWKDDMLFRIKTTLYSFNIAGRPLFMTSICVDCYMAVVYPITYMNLKHSRHRFVSSVFILSLTLCYGICLISRQTILVTPVTVIPYILALPIIVFCDVTILCTLRQPDPSGRREVHPQKQKALQAVTNSLVMTVVAYLPPIIIYVLSALIPLSNQERLCNVFIPSLCGPLLGSTIMPLLYLGNLRKLKGMSKCVVC